MEYRATKSAYEIITGDILPEESPEEDLINCLTQFEPYGTPPELRDLFVKIFRREYSVAEKHCDNSDQMASILRGHLNEAGKDSFYRICKDIILNAGVDLVRRSDEEKLGKLLEQYKWLVGNPNPQGNTLLHIATNGYGITSKAFDKSANEEEIKAALERRPKIAELLISKGANVGAKNDLLKGKEVGIEKGETPLDILKRVSTTEGKSEEDKAFAKIMIGCIDAAIKTPESATRATSFAKFTPSQVSRGLGEE